jgi:fluoride ion exporter CrcB/FEX
MRRLLLVFVGGGCGACLRALLLAWLQPWGVSLPVPVLLANLLGAFLLGVVSVLADEAVTVDAGGRGDWPGPARRLGVRDVHHQAAYSRGV